MSEPNTNGVKRNTQALGADRPQENIKDDAFAYAPFAETVAKAVLRLPDPHGQIIAIHGPWGMGKTSFLNFVKHYLRPEHVSAEENNQAPIVIDFNPWWFAGHEQLAGQFLAQFAAHLPKVDGRFHQIATDLTKYAGLIGALVSVANPALGAVAAAGLAHGKTEAKDVPTLKTEIAAALNKAEQRFLVVIDDIDRLEPKEIRELFKVLKALADFPNVIYLLAFDREMVAQSLGKELGIDGNAWLEKIVQAQFSLPKIMQDKLAEKFIKDAEMLLREPDGSNVITDTPYDGKPGYRPISDWDRDWSNGKKVFLGRFYEEGLSYFIQTPRDLVRLIGSLAVTYPDVRDHVNAHDFVLLECLRIFRPEVYAALRDHYAEFRSPEPESKVTKAHQPSSNAWLKETFKQWEEKEKNLINFKAINVLLSQLGFVYWGAETSVHIRSASSDGLMQKSMENISRPNLVFDSTYFPFYFQFGVAPEYLATPQTIFAPSIV